MIFDCARTCVNIHIDVRILLIDVHCLYIHELILLNLRTFNFYVDV